MNHPIALHVPHPTRDAYVLTMTVAAFLCALTLAILLAMLPWAVLAHPEHLPEVLGMAMLNLPATLGLLAGTRALHQCPADHQGRVDAPEAPRDDRASHRRHDAA